MKGLFLPVTLEQLARERGVLFNDRTQSCIESRANDEHGSTCIIHFLGSDITSASFAMYTQSASVLVQALTLICLSSFADHGPWRKKMLLTFAYLGSSFAMSIYWTCHLLPRATVYSYTSVHRIILSTASGTLLEFLCIICYDMRPSMLFFIDSSVLARGM